MARVGARGDTEGGNMQEMDRGRKRQKEKEKYGVMTKLQALCLYMHPQAN